MDDGAGKTTTIADAATRANGKVMMMINEGDGYIAFGWNQSWSNPIAMFEILCIWTDVK